MKLPFVIYADLECILKKYIHFKMILKNLIQGKKDKHTLSGYSLLIQSSFHATKNKFDCYRGTDSMKNFYSDFREHTTKIFNYEKKNKCYH